MSDPVIQTENLTKRYGRATAVDHISFSIGRGEIFGLLGPNGAGKTTTILMLLGLSDISEGTARVLGRDPAREPLTVKRQVGYLPDAVGFYDYLSAVDNLRYTARLIGIPAAGRDDRIRKALHRVGLGGVADQKVATYSRGMRQRLGLGDPDEGGADRHPGRADSGLDPQATDELLEMIRGLKRDGVTVLLSSHLLQRVQSVCDRVALFRSGRIALMGTVAELGRQVLGGGFVVEIEAQGGGLAPRLARIPGVSAVEEGPGGRIKLRADRDVRAEAAAEIIGAGGGLTYLSIEEATLEAIYARHFQGTVEGGRRHAA